VIAFERKIVDIARSAIEASFVITKANISTIITPIIS